MAKPEEIDVVVRAVEEEPALQQESGVRAWSVDDPRRNPQRGPVAAGLMTASGDLAVTPGRIDEENGEGQ